jgi:hypothetical protein
VTDNDEGLEDHRDDALLSRLRLIEDRPLEERPDAYLRIHRELADVLEGHDVERQDG